MKSKKLLIIAVIALVFFAGGVVKTYADSIGYIDLQKVLMSYNEAKKAEEDFRKKQEENQKQFDQKQAEIEKAKTEKKSDKEIKELITKFEQELEPKKQELVKLNQELTNKLKGKIFEAAGAVAKEYGLDIGKGDVEYGYKMPLPKKPVKKISTTA